MHVYICIYRVGGTQAMAGFSFVETQAWLRRVYMYVYTDLYSYIYIIIAVYIYIHIHIFIYRNRITRHQEHSVKFCFPRHARVREKSKRAICEACDHAVFTHACLLCCSVCMAQMGMFWLAKDGPRSWKGPLKWRHALLEPVAAFLRAEAETGRFKPVLNLPITA